MAGLRHLKIPQREDERPIGTAVAIADDEPISRRSSPSWCSRANALNDGFGNPNSARTP
jgi:hypothetical protein